MVCIAGNEELRTQHSDNGVLDKTAYPCMILLPEASGAGAPRPPPPPDRQRRLLHPHPPLPHGLRLLPALLSAKSLSRLPGAGGSSPPVVFPITYGIAAAGRGVVLCCGAVAGSSVPGRSVARSVQTSPLSSLLVFAGDAWWPSPAGDGDTGHAVGQLRSRPRGLRRSFLAGSDDAPIHSATSPGMAVAILFWLYAFYNNFVCIVSAVIYALPHNYIHAGDGADVWPCQAVVIQCMTESTVVAGGVNRWWQRLSESAVATARMAYCVWLGWPRGQCLCSPVDC